VSAALAGTVAQLTSPATAMTVIALASITVTLTLAAAGRRRTGDTTADLAPTG
jgi:hypothetical protein